MFNKFHSYDSKFIIAFLFYTIVLLDTGRVLFSKRSEKKRVTFTLSTSIVILIYASKSGIVTLFVYVEITFHLRRSAV